MKNLQLQYEPAGVSLYKEEDPLPGGISFSQKELKSYCQAVILAGEGEILLLEKEKMGCKLGTSVLGFEKEMEAAGVDYKLINHPGAKHSFTSPAADGYAKKFNMPLAYDPVADKKSWQSMQDFFKKIF